MSARTAGAESVTLREAGAFDLQTLAALHAACFEDRWDAAAMGALLAVPGTFAVLALVGERPAGFIMARVAAGEAELLTVGVDPPFRGRGFGTRLVAAACAHAAGAGARSLYLEVAEDDPAARRLYELAGFIAVGRRARYYRRAGHGVDALVLHRPLDGANDQNSAQNR